MLTLLMLINLQRVQPLQQTQELNSLAQVRAQQLYQSNQWSHDNWKRSFDTTSCKWIGENLARGFTNDTDLNNAMLNSPVHKANMVNPRFKELGIGKYKGVTVELFCGK